MKGEVRPGYKQTEVGVIPQDWQSEALANILAIVGGGTPSTSVPEFWDGRIPWVSAGDISRATGRYVLDTMDHISELGLSSCPARILPTGTVVIIARGATTGRMAQLGSDMAFNQTCYGLRAANGLDQDYLYYAMQYSIRSTGVLAYGTIFRTITTQSFEQWRIPLPSTLAEQQAIAEALSDVDALISALDRLIAKKRAIKQGAMQELLTGRRRLPGFDDEWQTKKLGVIAPLQRGFDLPASQLQPGSYPVVYSNGILNHHSVAMAKAPGVVTGRSGTIGTVTYVDEDYWPHNTSLWVTDFRGNDPRFVFYLYNYLGLDRFAMGSGVPTLNRNDVHGYEVRIPPAEEEQTAIATVLSDMDAEIAALERRRDKTKLLKQGMMQELLTGRTRLV